LNEKRSPEFSPLLRKRKARSSTKTRLIKEGVDRRKRTRTGKQEELETRGSGPLKNCPDAKASYLRVAGSRRKPTLFKRGRNLFGEGRKLNLAKKLTSNARLPL